MIRCSLSDQSGRPREGQAERDDAQVQVGLRQPRVGRRRHRDQRQHRRPRRLPPTEQVGRAPLRDGARALVPRGGHLRRLPGNPIDILDFG